MFALSGLRQYQRGDFEFPSTAEMVGALEAAASEDTTLGKMLESRKNGILCVGDEKVEINDDACSVADMAVVFHLARQSTAELSLEVGFGLGMSAAAILAGRGTRKHIVMDPYLLGGRGELAYRLLSDVGLELDRRPSEIALAERIADHAKSLDFIFIDGGHRIENVFVDFALSDKLIDVGGSIVFDDARFPAIETLVSYVYYNRSDYEIADLVAGGLTVLRKAMADSRTWDHFAPFTVPRRRNWTSRSGYLSRWK